MSVGIVITCHNEAPWILEAVDSALAQTWPAHRIVVVDDGSTDESPALLERRSSRVDVLTVSQRGMAAARNVGLMATAGCEWVVHLDGDDRLAPDFVAETRAYAPGYDAVLTKMIRDDGLVHLPGPTNLGDVVERCELHSCALFYRRALVEIGGFRSDLGGDCDWGAWVELLANGGGVGYCDSTAYHYRRRAGSLTSTEGPEDRARHHALIRELARRDA